MGMRNYFSGVEGEQHYNACIAAGAKHVLTSFLYLERTDLDTVKKRKRKNPEVKFLIDSGAHTFQSDKDKYSSWSLRDFEKYIERYIKWLRANREYVEACVELDIDWNVGTNVVEGWQKKYFIPLMREGLDVIFVWHKQRGLDGLEEMCSRYPYVGLPGEFSKEPDFNKYVTIAKRYTTKLHGFAATKQSDFRDWPWYSGDSTTWKSSERYGTLIHWDEHDQRLVFEDDKGKRMLYRKDFEAFGLDADGIINDTNYREVTKYALISMRRMEEFYEKKYSDRIFYYSLRLPHPDAIMAIMSQAEVKRYWALLRAPTLFKAHATEPKIGNIRRFLATVSAVQHRETGFIEQSEKAKAFLGTYFPQLVRGNTLNCDAQVFQKELSSYIAPPNPPALARTEPFHYIATNNVPKVRDPRDFDINELEHDPLSVPLIAAEI
jgi:hypothetical protein